MKSFKKKTAKWTLLHIHSYRRHIYCYRTWRLMHNWSNYMVNMCLLYRIY